MDRNTLDQLLESALAVRKNAYAPYSNFHVGCAMLLEDGTVVNGVNVENASYGVTICAERSAIVSIVTAGKQNSIRAVAVGTATSPPAAPCGICRQALAEFVERKVPIILGNDTGESTVSCLAEFLPFAFEKSALGK
jgi:cytidine deaminase